MKKRMKQAADQEYTYWLGKRAISTLSRYNNWKRANKQMTEMVTKDRSVETKRRVLSSLALYCKFYRARRIQDEKIVKLI